MSLIPYGGMGGLTAGPTLFNHFTPAYHQSPWASGHQWNPRNNRLPSRIEKLLEPKDNEIHNFFSDDPTPSNEKFYDAREQFPERQLSEVNPNSPSPRVPASSPVPNSPKPGNSPYPVGESPHPRHSPLPNAASTLPGNSPLPLTSPAPVPTASSPNAQSNDYYDEPAFWADDPIIKVNLPKHETPRDKCIREAATLPRKMRVMFCEATSQQLVQQTKALLLNLLPQPLKKAWNIQEINPAPRVNRKALLIGMQYVGGKAPAVEIQGTITDMKQMKQFLTADLKFDDNPQSIRMMTDERTNQNTPLFPTRQNIIQGLHWLVDGAQAGDSLFLHYSGHGKFKKTPNAQREKDGNEEYILPVDMNTAGPILDNELYDILVKSLPDGVQMIILFDSCSSCTMLDLPFVYEPNGKVSQQYPVSPPVQPQKPWYSRLYNYHQQKPNPPKIYMFGAARETETDYPINTEHGVMGSLTRAFIKTVRRNPNQSYLSILREVREKIYTIGYQKLQHQCLATNMPDQSAIREKFDI